MDLYRDYVNMWGQIAIAYEGMGDFKRAKEAQKSFKKKEKKMNNNLKRRRTRHLLWKIRRLSEKRVMIEDEKETQVKNAKIPDGFDFNNLIATVLVREPFLLYFVCRRGSWVHQNSRGKKHPPLDPRGIINDREIDSKFLAKYQVNNRKKDSHLISVKSRIKWVKSMHTMPAKYCKLTKLGKKLY